MDEKIKEVADKHINIARASLEQNGYLYHIMITVKDDKDQPMAFDNEEDLIEVMNMETPVSDAIITILNTDMANLDEIEEIESVKNLEESYDCLVCFVYTPETSYIKSIPYVENENGLLFFDKGWEDVTLNGAYNNPYMKKEDEI